jgi:beta-glucosidase
MFKKLTAAMAVASTCFMPYAGASQAQSPQSTLLCPWLDKTQSPEKRADEFVAAATDAEKASMTGATFSALVYFGLYGHIAENPRLCFPGLTNSDGGAGVADFNTGLVKGVTKFPAVSDQTATWNPKLEERYGRVLADEHRGKGNGVIFNPAMNMVRVPQGGRTFEYMGEDPYLAGEMGLAMVRGIQSEGLIAQAKHFAMNSQETNRNIIALNKTTISEVADERTIRESELPAFEKVVEQGHIGSIMCAYNKINGTQACENDWLLNKVLKGEWQFKGWVSSDYGAAKSQDSINAGLDQEQNIHPPIYLGAAMLPLVATGEVSHARLDDMVHRLVLQMFRVGLFDNPPTPEPQAYQATVTNASHLAMARRIATEGTVLLKNHAETLPLHLKGKKVLVLGSGAINPHQDGDATPMGGGGSSRVAPYNPIYPCDALTARAAELDATITCDGTTDPVAAAALAKRYDVTIVFAYRPSSEGADLPDLALPDTPLIDAVSKVNHKTVVMLQTGNSMDMPWLPRVPAVLEGWYGGEQFGNAFADILLGDAEPGGRLPFSFLRSEKDSWIRSPAQFPGVNLESSYTERLLWGYRWFDARKVAPQFPFGHGLSYTTWRYSHLKLTPVGDHVHVSYNITNTGSREGSDVGQVYVAFPSAAGEPPQQLKGFQKVQLASGASQRVTVDLDARAFQIWSTAGHGWRTIPGCYRVTVARSSRDPQLSDSLGRANGQCTAADAPDTMLATAAAGS